MSAELIAQAADVLHHEPAHAVVFDDDMAEALADVLDVIAYVKKYEGHSDYFATPDGDPVVRLARLIVGEQS